MNFSDRLHTAVIRSGSTLCVGLDPRWDLLPPEVRTGESLPEQAAAYREFCCAVIDSVADIVPVVKPQAAFFEALGPAGVAALAEVNRYARSAGLLVVLDAKRGDIGSTAEAYAAAYCTGDRSPWSCDAVTINGFLGQDTLTPIVASAEAHGAGVFVLVKTSNPGSGDVQDAALSGRSVSERYAAWIEQQNRRWLNESMSREVGRGLIGAVVGATHPQQLRELRQQMQHAWLLIPGYGAQGGRSEDLAGIWHPDGGGAIVNSSRGVIFAFQERPTDVGWTDYVRRAAQQATEDLNRHRS